MSVGKLSTISHPSQYMREPTQGRDPMNVTNVGKPSIRVTPHNTSENTLGRNTTGVMEPFTSISISVNSRETVLRRNPCQHPETFTLLLDSLHSRNNLGLRWGTQYI